MHERTAFFLLIIFFIPAALFSCGDCSRKIDCPGYKDDTLDAWFPYWDDQQLVFVSTANRADTVTLKNTETTEPYQATSGVYGPAPYCNARKAFESLELNALKQHKMSVELSTGKYTRSARFSLGENSFSLYDLTENSPGQVTISNRPAVLQMRPAVTLGNRTFTHLVEAISDTAHLDSGRLYKLYFAKGEGLVAYREFPSLLTWIKQ